LRGCVREKYCGLRRNLEYTMRNTDHHTVLPQSLKWWKSVRIQK